MATQYLQQILTREAVDNSVYSPVLGVRSQLLPTIQRWANRFLRDVTPSGSFAKGTANKSGTDIDLFISLDETTSEPLKEVYDSLFNALKGEGYQPLRQNVSININVAGYDVDLVPAKRQNALNQDHSLYRRKADTWTKTNVQTHITMVRQSGRQDVIRILKLWRRQKAIEFPSFYLEMSAIKALNGFGAIDLSQAVVNVLGHWVEHITSERILDPANTNNIVSDDLTQAEKQIIGQMAATGLRQNWSDLVK
ncbi:MAG: nucleotidyltransferase domain-containing protein [Sphingorhabdus sp.]